MRPAVRHGTDRQTVAQGRTQAKALITSARSISMWTPEALSRCYLIPVREAEAMLSAENARRDRLAI